MSRRRDRSRPCPCGRAALGACCGPVLAGRPAVTPEDLMRSRYTAFALGDAGHLLRTWHPDTRPEALALEPDLRWTGLEVLWASTSPFTPRGEVAFRARWAQGGRSGAMAERSRFARVDGQWLYLDGTPVEEQTGP